MRAGLPAAGSLFGLRLGRRSRRRSQIPRLRASERIELLAPSLVGDAPAGHPSLVWPDRRLRDSAVVAHREGVHVPHHPAGVAHHDRPRGDVAADDGERADDALVSDGRAGQDDRAGSHEDALADDGAGDARVPGVQPGAAVVGQDHRAGRQNRALADRDEPRVPAIEEHALSDVDVRPEFESLRDEGLDVLITPEAPENPPRYRLDGPDYRPSNSIAAHRTKPTRARRPCASSLAPAVATPGAPRGWGPGTLPDVLSPNGNTGWPGLRATLGRATRRGLR